MQDVGRQSNPDRTQKTRGALVEAARKLFLQRPYAETGTPEIVALAGVTRGALYHHFADKQALFLAVVEAESAAVADAVKAATATIHSPQEALTKGGEAFLEVMSHPGRTRLLLIEAPSVLGRRRVDELDEAHAGATLREGLDAAARAGAIRDLPVGPTAQLLSSAFDRAALAIENGADAAEWRLVLARLLTAIFE